MQPGTRGGPAQYHDENTEARRLGLSVFTLRADRSGARRIPYVKLPNGRVLYDPARVDEALRKYERGGP